jgi:hypothetical protein
VAAINMAMAATTTPAIIRFMDIPSMEAEWIAEPAGP